MSVTDAVCVSDARRGGPSRRVCSAHGLQRNQVGSFFASAGGPETSRAPLANGAGPAQRAAEHLGQRRRGHAHHQVGVGPGVVPAHRRLAAVEHEPDPDRRRSGVVELHDDPSRRQAVAGHPPVHPPHEHRGLDVVLEVLVAPLDRPAAHRLEHRLEVLAGGGEVVLAAAPGRRRPGLDHPAALEVAEALGEQRAGHAGQAAGDVVEAGVAEEQLPHDQGRPPIGEDLAGQGDRAEPSVLGHGGMVARRRRAG